MPLDLSTPKQNFIKENSRVEAHRSLISHPSFNVSIETAMAEFTNELLSAIPDNANEGAGKAFALSGAQRFVQTLRNLSELPERPRMTPTATLNHRA